jgi:hypothetical protein
MVRDGKVIKFSFSPKSWTPTSSDTK